MLLRNNSNPIVFKFAARHLGLFPQPNGEIESNIQCLGRELVNYLYSDNYVRDGREISFDERYFVEKGAYRTATQVSENGVYPSGIPYCQDDDEINQYMDRHINWRNGDALFLLGYLNSQVMNQMYENMTKRVGFFGVYESVLDRPASVVYL